MFTRNYHYLLLLLYIGSFTAHSASGMEREKTITKETPLSLDPRSVVPQQIIALQLNKQLLSQNQLEALTSEAQKGNAHLQYLLGCYYYYGLTPNKNPDLQQAESWFLKARNNDFLRAFLLLAECADKQGDNKKCEQYVQEAIDRGFTNYYYNLFKIYYRQQKYHQAEKALHNVIAALKDHQGNPYFKRTVEDAEFNWALLLKKGYLGTRDLKQAITLLTKLAKKNHAESIYHLALIFLTDEEQIPKNVKKAEKLLLKIEKMKHLISPYASREDRVTYLQSLNTLGNIYEKEHKNIEKAVEQYTKYKNGPLDIARLIITQKIPGDAEHAKTLLKSSYENGSPLARYIYGTLLIMEGEQSNAIEVLEKNHSTIEREWHPLVALQLGIAYQHGFGVDQNKAKAQQYFHQILNDPDISYRSVLLARGYMYLFGLGGVKKDIYKGLELIKDSESKNNDVYFDTQELFPIIKKIWLQNADSAAQEIIEQERKQKEKKQNKKKAIPLPVEEDDPFDVTEEQWNATFEVQDGSHVSCIDKKAKKFVIDDPKREQQLIITLENMPERELSEIDALTYHKRIFERQGNGKRKLHKSTKYNHDFAEMLDYAIQYLGERVPFIKAGSEHPDDQIIATVLRRDLKTGKEILCKAEYTFGQKDQDVYVYHRLLRPIKNQNAP